MGTQLDCITDELAEFLMAQPVFFVATAPQAADQHVNVSPKGLDSFAVLDPMTVACADFVGSGIETVSHLKENGRITLMFCAFHGPPKIARLHGTGEAIEASSEQFEPLAAQFPSSKGVRAVIRVHCHRVSTSCGYGVPLMKFERHRTQLGRWVEQKGIDGLTQYQKDWNAESIDGLPGIDLSKL